jgi:hypothetical protein
MIKPKQNKLPKLTRSASKRKAGREASMLAARREAESKPSTFLVERDTRVQKRKATIAETKATGEWLRVKEIASHVVEKEGANFDDDKRKKIEITVCNRIVSDCADGKLGTEQAPALMLLSEEYDETELKPSDLAQVLKTGFDRVYGDERRLKIAEFLIAHGWMKWSVATKWLGPQYSLPQPPQGRVATTAGGETSCRQWLTSTMEKHESRPKTKGAFFHEARQKFQVGRRAFNRAWDDAIGATGKANWRNAGRPKSPDVARN